MYRIMPAENNEMRPSVNNQHMCPHRTDTSLGTFFSHIAMFMTNEAKQTIDYAMHKSNS